MTSRQRGRELRARARRRAVLFGLAVAIVAAGLILSALRFRPLVAGAQLPAVRAAGIGAVRSVSPPLDAAGMGDIALDTAYTWVAAYNVEQARRARILEIGYRLHECEQGGTANEWYIDGNAGNGQPVKGGLGMHVTLYQKYAGHDALQDSPEEQIMTAYRAKVGEGAQWGEHCRGIANEWLGVR